MTEQPPNTEPHSDPDDTSALQRGGLRWLILAIIVVVCAGGIVLWWTGRDTGTASPSATAPVSERPNLPSAPISESPTADPSASSAPSPQAGQDDPDEPPTIDGPTPGFSPTAQRSPEPGDDAAAQQALTSVVPVWASINLTDDRSGARWRDTFRELPGSSTALSALSNKYFYDLYGGAIQSGVNLADAKITNSRKLWSVGANSLWRVNISRQIQSGSDDHSSDGADTVTYDFLIEQGDDARIVGFKDPAPENEKPETFRPWT